MSYEPSTLLAVRSYLQPRTGLPAVSLGIVGAAGVTGGYHLGWDRLQRHRGRGDYSVRESPRDANPTNAAMAIDIGQFNQQGKTLRELSRWLVAESRAGAPDTRDIREIIYSPDGRVVRRWDRLGIRSSGDDSHLTHTHISYFRDSERRGKLGPFRRYFEGDDVTPEENWRHEIRRVSDGEPRAASRLLAWSNHASFQARDQARVNSAKLDAVLAQLAGQDVAAAAAAAARQAVRDEFGKLGPALAEELSDVPAERIEAALRAVLGSLDNPA